MNCPNQYAAKSDACNCTTFFGSEKIMSAAHSARHFGAGEPFSIRSQCKSLHLALILTTFVRVELEHGKAASFAVSVEQSYVERRTIQELSCR